MPQSDESGLIHKGDYLSLYKRNGWEFITRHNCTGIVIIVPVTVDNEVVFIEQFREPLNMRVIEFPAGLVNDEAAENHESLQEAAERELLEETGFQAEYWQYVMDGPVSAGSSSDLVSVFLARGAQRVHDGGGDENECIDVHVVPYQHTKDWLRERGSQDVLIEPKIYAGLYFLNEYNDANIC